MPEHDRIRHIQLGSDPATPVDVAAKAAQLRTQINHANRLYYVDNAPEMADAEWDSQMRRLRTLEREHPELQTPDSPTQRVGAPPADEFAEVIHPVPMLSLGNAFDEDSLRAWYRRALEYLEIETAPMVCELKIDGLALAVTYRDGVMERATTRGDGERGEDVTANVRTIRSIPLRLDGDVPPLIELRGEVFFPNSKFEALNTEREEAGLPPYVNPRNSASGSLRQLESTETTRKLRSWRDPSLTDSETTFRDDR